MGKKTTVTGGPTLFNAETVLRDADRFDEVYNAVERQHDQYDETGIYSPFIPEELKPRAKAAYINTAEQLRDVLTGSGATPETINVVLTDYAALLCGPCEPTATPQQMIEALKAIKPIRAFFIDRYCLYFGLLLHYSRCLNILKRYEIDVHNPDTATTETKQIFQTVNYGAMDAKAICWLIRSEIMRLDDWRGFEPANVSAWIENKKELAAVGEYGLFYLIAKCTYNATPQELQTITQPKINTQIPINEFAENAARDIIIKLTKTAARFAEIAEAETKAAQEQATEAATDWKNTTNDKIIKLHETPNIICSRAVEISPNGAEIINTLPVQLYIEDFTKRNPDKYGVITPMTIYKVFEAVNLLPNFCNTVENGKFVFRTTKTRFAEICGYKDANQAEKMALLGGLRVLSNLYVVVNRPTRIITTEGKNGRKRHVTTGGKTAVQVLNVPEFELENEGIIITISPEAMKGKPTLITADKLTQLRAEAKGIAQTRFNAQLLAKGHKTEDDLTAEVFGYDEKLKLAGDNPEAYKQAKTYIQNHRSDDRKKIAKWFEDYRGKGLIKYTFDKKTRVYKWERVGDIPEPKENPYGVEFTTIN